MRNGVELMPGMVIDQQGEVVYRLMSLHPERRRVIVDYEAPWGIATRECLAAAIGAEFVADESVSDQSVTDGSATDGSVDE